MNFSSSKPSLISYLVPSNNNKFYLQFAASDKNGGTEASQFPFLSLASSDPFASIIEASINTDAHCTIQRVFLLLQKDVYPFAGNALWPISNHDIDQSWQDSFSLLRALEPPDSIIVLNDQMDDSKNLRRWRSLFCCLKRQVFFHPSCPKCGSLLDLCSDDDLLIRVGLQPYSTTLKRYLFCPHCYDTLGDSAFYVPMKGHSDPLNVKDQRDLIKGFGQLQANQANATNNPCPECPNFNACYGPGDLALSRIVSVGFYPFFMLLLRAPSLHLLDFLPLLSGATFKEQREELKAKGQVGRLTYLRQFERACSGRTLFFFEKDDRFSLEVLYLKLSLLTDLARVVLPNLGKLRYPDLDLSIDRFWVSVAEQNPTLPFFWNFRPRSLGVGSDRTKGPHLPKLPPAYGLYLLGSIWFYVLLANNRHRVPMLYEGVAAALEEISPERGTPTHGPLIDESEGIFAPENILWDPDRSVFNPAWKTLWSEAVSLGFFLLENSKGDLSKWPENAFWDKLDRLRTAAKKALFMPNSSKEAPREETDAVIHKILGRIHEKWRHASPEITTEPKERPADTPLEDSDPSDDLVVKETVILSPEAFEKEGSPSENTEEGKEAGQSTSQRPDVPIPPEAGRIEEDDLPKTIIVASDAARGEAREKGHEAVDATGLDLPQTLIFSPGEVKASPADARRTRSGGAGVLDGPTQDPSAEKVDNGLDAGPVEKEEDPDALPETMIFRRDKIDKEP